MSSVEVVLLTPLIVTMMLIIISLGVMVNVRSEVAGAARDAARAGSLQGSGGEAAKQAELAAKADLGDRCQGAADITGAYVPPTAGGGGYYRVTVTCTIDMSGFGVFGAHQTFTKVFSSPIDPLQNFVPGDAPTTSLEPPPSSEPSPTSTQFTAPSWNSPTPPPSSPTPSGATPSGATPSGTTPAGSASSPAPSKPSKPAPDPKPTTPAGH
ncbi:MAG: hypothetical protein HOW97_14030 [Catenulispora sp.]|nr:hypothetical protein [Catenulispora sp.]